MPTQRQTLIALGIIAAVLAFRNFNLGKRGADVDSLMATWLPAAGAALALWTLRKG